ncbi:hypothetical protein PCANC_01325 [Puccinia coronata f. sp. avenae]|uniref:Uncharacterized protein n=1 Tax=Puccinia coronata f. sp. avenae TaxID=200324 RepID=A0A2N5SBV1_9BASI|nr:hypothetical protein PCANC_22657 [Puccinia coronata f. sp. avenae]PLW57739.1 hypothetical protein PCANC_01325 [Puccinia coronata f. sp. avenae]
MPARPILQIHFVRDLPSSIQLPTSKLPPIIESAPPLHYQTNMFPTLKLFDRINCPDNRPPRSTCSRVDCLFSHLTPPPEPKPVEKKKEKPKQKAPPPSSQTAAQKSGQIDLQPPRIEVSRTSGSSHTFPPVRQKLLDTLYQEYLKLYQSAAKLPDVQARTAARRDSLQEELDCLRASNQKTYRNTVISRVVQIRKRANEPDHRSFTGTMAEFNRFKLASQASKT